MLRGTLALLIDTGQYSAINDLLITEQRKYKGAFISHSLNWDIVLDSFPDLNGTRGRVWKESYPGQLSSFRSGFSTAN